MNFIESTIIDAALTQSIWAGLSIALIFYILKKQDARDKTQSERETKYQYIIENLTDKLDILDELKDTVDEIGDLLKK